MRVVCLVQARMGSHRLPGKSLRPLAGKPMVLHALERARATGLETWLATTRFEEDTLLVETAQAAGFRVHRGSDWDVLDRMAEAADASRADVVVRVTGDCPLTAPDVIGRVLALYLESPLGIVTNDTTHSGYPDGLDVEVFGAALLREAAKRATGSEDREHVTRWMRRHVAHHVLANDEDWRRVKLSVDSPDDFELVRRVFGNLLARDAYGWPATRAAYLGLTGGANGGA